MIKKILLILIFINALWSQQNSEEYTKAYLAELNKSNDMFLAQEAGRAADKRIPDNDFVSVYNIKKFNGLKEIKFEKITINEEQELNKMIQYETTKQLNQFSAIFYKKIEINSRIDEL